MDSYRYAKQPRNSEVQTGGGLYCATLCVLSSPGVTVYHSPTQQQVESIHDGILTIEEMAEIFRRSKGGIRTAIWRYRRLGIDPGLPLPTKESGRLRWLKSGVSKYLLNLAERQKLEDKPYLKTLPGGSS